MLTENALLEHMAACELTYQLMLDENRLLKTTGTPPGDDFLGQKRIVLRQLETALVMLRSLGDPLPDFTPEQRATIRKTQQIVLKALLLDRENEQLLLKSTAPPRPEMPRMRATLDQVRRIYQKHQPAGEGGS